MNFISLIYALFLLISVAIYWLVGRSSESLKLWLLLIVSLTFYACLQVYYIPLLLVIILINFRLAKAIAKNAVLSEIRPKNKNVSEEYLEKLQGFWNRRGSKILWLGITINVLLLLGFKYIPFLLNSFAAVVDFPAATEKANWISKSIIAPLGISFFTFECIAYLVDVYRGAPATKKFLNFASYKLFFPKLISGPIIRYNYFANQVVGQQFPPFEQCIEGVWLIACGALKKALIADRLAIFVDLSFGNLERAGSGDLWLAILAYGLQLYLDFSGYVDIARGSAKLLGFNLPENFDFPYFSTSIADFWRRWHITLGDWLRNYLYFPLGGSRQGLAKTCLNLLLIMLIAGIWHGAAWGYVVWGIVHGVALIGHRLVESLSEGYQWAKNFWKTVPGIIFAWIVTQLMVFSSWILFRLPNLNQAGLVYQHLWNYSGDIQFAQKVYIEAIGMERPYVAVLLAMLVAVMALVYFVQRGSKLQLNWPVKLVLVPLCLYVVWLLSPEGGLPYIYFNF
ncbi:MAG: MBOAT family protein [Moorea sp. SIO2B7]|nr:MBOAT family protein [Moorena sp. SIO2B7]